MIRIIDKNIITDILLENTATVIFTKVDGSKRELKCTLDPEILPKKLSITPTSLENPPRADNPNVINVWDIENMSWRSFKLDSVISIDVD